MAKRKQSLYIFCLLAFTLLFCANASALEHWYLPMAREIKTVLVLNPDSQSHSFWISRPYKGGEDSIQAAGTGSMAEPKSEPGTNSEDSFEVPAFGSLEIPLIPYSDESYVHMKSDAAGEMKVQVLTSFSKAYFLSSGSQNKWKVRGRPDGELVLSNLAPFLQTVTLSTGGAGGHKESHILGSFETKRIALNSSSLNSTSTISLEGEARFGGALVSPSQSQGFIADDKKATLRPTQSFRYFLVSNTSGSQNFSIQVSDVDLLEKIDRQIASPTSFMPRILIGKIDYGHGEHNRDFSSANSSPWSWHVSKVLSFADLALQACDGSPEFLEEVLGPWKQSGSPICFWSYRVTRELSIDEVRTGILAPAPISHTY